MAHEFEVRGEIEVEASPEQVWEAIATGPGVDSWFMGHSKMGSGVGGRNFVDMGGFAMESTITGWEPGRHLAFKGDGDPDGVLHAFEYLIEGRDGGSTVVRFVHSGFLGDDWENEYDALRRGWPFHLNTLREYLAHFPGRTAVPVFGMAPAGDRSPEDVQALLAGALSLTAPIATGARAHGGPADQPLVDGEVVWADSERFGVRTADGLYTFHHGSGIALMFHHLFAPADAPGGTDAELSWQHWLTRTIPGTTG